jgi:hypothetical protein
MAVFTPVEGEKSDGLTLVSITTTCISPTLELIEVADISDMTLL